MAMSNVMKFSGAIQVGSLASPPSNPASGFIYFDSGSGKFAMYENGAFRTVSAQAIEAHLTDDASLKHEADEIDYERADGSRKNIQPDATSPNVETALNDLDDAIGVLSFGPVNYSPSSPGIVASHLAAIDTQLGNVTSDFSDSAFRVHDNGDATKKMAFEVSAITTGTTRTVTMPDSNVDLGKVATAIQKDGSVTFTQNQPMGSHKLTGLSAGSGAGDSVRYEQAILASGVNAFGADQSMGGFKLTNLADPVSGTDAVNMNYLSARLNGLKPKQSVRAATTVAGTLASSFEDGDSIDGVTLVTGDRILIKDQAAPAANGIYTVNASGAPTRATDFDSLSPIDEINGAWVAVQEGTANAGKIYVQYGIVATLGTDAINFEYFNPIASLIGGDMITFSSSTFSVDLATASGLESTNPGNAAGQLRIKLEASNPSLKFSGSNELGSKLDGAGAITSGASGLKVGVDNSTLEINSNALRVKAAGITNNEVASGIDAVKIGAGSVDNTEFGYLDGVTSSIQTQLNGKEPTITTLSIAKGGTNSGTALNNNRVMKSSGGAIVEAAAITAARALISDANGIPTHSAVTATELGYVSGVTSAIQTQLNSKLSSVSQDTAPALGGNLDVSGFSIEGASSEVLLAGQNSVRRAKQASKTSFVEEEYIHSIALAGSQSGTVISALTFAFASFEGLEITYKIKQTTSGNVRIGTIRVATNGTVAVLNDMWTDSADLGMSFSAAINGANVEISYSSGSNGGTMRADVKKIKA